VLRSRVLEIETISRQIETPKAYLKQQTDVPPTTMARLRPTFETYQDFLNGKRWDVRLDFVRLFKSELVRRLEGLVFEKKKYIIKVRFG